MKKRAFTLTELLVVVVIIGVLSAIVLPKFTKVLETRKTTEAEAMLMAVRSEQEARCALDRPYLQDTQKGQLAVLPSNTGSNYTYTLTGSGITASSQDKDYALKIESYQDGSICCSGTYCASLNKKYPACTGVSSDTTGCGVATPISSVNPCADGSCEPEGPCDKTAYDEKCPSGEGFIHYTVNENCEYVKDASECTSPSRLCIPGTRKEEARPSCGPKTWRECKTDGSGWEDKEDTSLTESEKQNCGCDEEEELVKACDTGNGTQTRTKTCDTATGKWTYSDWDDSACKAESVCVAGEKKDEVRKPCGPKTWQECNEDGSGWENREDAALTTVEKESCACDEAQELAQPCETGNGTQTRTKTCDQSTGKWTYSDWDASTCDCPSGTEWKEGEGCVARTYCEYGKPGWDKWSDKAQNCEQGVQDSRSVLGKWNTDTCECDCPKGTTRDTSGACMKTCDATSDWDDSACQRCKWVYYYEDDYSGPDDCPRLADEYAIYLRRDNGIPVEDAPCNMEGERGDLADVYCEGHTVRLYYAFCVCDRDCEKYVIPNRRRVASGDCRYYDITR